MPSYIDNQGLSQGVSYQYQVSAVNAVGEGPRTPSVSATLQTPAPGAWFGLSDPWAGRPAFGAYPLAPALGPGNTNGNMQANQLGGLWYTGNAGGAVILSNKTFRNTTPNANVVVLSGLSNAIIRDIDFENVPQGFYIDNCNNVLIERIRMYNNFGPFLITGSESGNFIAMMRSSNMTIQDFKVKQPNPKPSGSGADWGTEDIISMGCGNPPTHWSNALVQRFMIDGGDWQSWSGTGMFLGDGDLQPGGPFSGTITVQDGVFVNPGQCGIGTGEGGPHIIRRVDMWQDAKQFTSSINGNTVRANNPGQFRGTTQLGNFRCRFVSGAGPALAGYTNSGSAITLTGPVDQAWPGPKPVVTL